MELDNGSVHAFGMDVNDHKNVIEMEVPKGQHIKDVILRSGLYIDQLGFITNENIQLGPVGGTGGDQNYVQSIHKIYQNVKQWYLQGIKGTLVQTDKDSSSIAQLQFVFVVVQNT